MLKLAQIEIRVKLPIDSCQHIQVESSRHAQWKVYRLLPSLAPGLRAVLDGLLSAARTQTVLLSDLEHMEAILKDPRYSFCCDFATPRRRAKKIATPIRSK